MNIDNLKKEIPFKWRVQSFSKNKPSAVCVAYINSRSVQDILDEVCGAHNWQDDYKEVKGNVYAGIGIKIKDEWVWKWDCGTESKEDKEKGEASDSFKRAAVKWGVGRFLYNQKVQYVNANVKKENNNYPYCIDENNQRIWDLTKYINDRLNKKTPSKKTSKPILSKWTDNNKTKTTDLYDALLQNALEKGLSVEAFKENYIISEELEKEIINDLRK